MAIQHGLAAWDGALGASETLPERNRVREDGRSPGRGPSFLGRSRLVRRYYGRDRTAKVVVGNPNALNENRPYLKVRPFRGGGGPGDRSIQAITAPIRTSRRGMSAFGGKADVIQGVAGCPLLAISGHSDSTWPFTPLDVESSRRQRRLWEI